MATARSFRSKVDARRPCTASRPSVIARAACAIAPSSFSFASAGRSGSRYETVWNRSSSPWKLWSSVSCSSRAIRVRSATRASSVISNACCTCRIRSLVRPPQEHQEQPRGRGAKPGGLIPRRRDDDRQRHSLFVPDAVAVRSLHAKHVIPVIEVGVGRQPLFAVHLAPVRVEALEPVSITVLVRVRVAQCREFKRKHVLPIGQRQRLHVRNRPSRAPRRRSERGR